MRPITGQMLRKLIFLVICGFLSACCGLCTTCPDSAECSINPSNAATGIKSSAGSIAPAADTEGWHASYPMFEGDYFSVTLPATAPDSLPSGAVHDLLSDMGFADPTGGDVLTGEFFSIKPHLVSSGGGDILKVAQINCETGPQPGPNDPTSFCNMTEDQKILLIERATGMKAHDYLNRKLNRHFFYQRPQYREWPTDPSLSEELCVPNLASPGNCIDINVFIEHVAIAATTRPDGTVSSISGRVLPSYKITNEPKLTPVKAVEAAYEHLWKIPGISQYSGEPAAKQELPLVLLPYAHTRRFDLGRLGSFKWPSYRTPQLRYAYRTTLYGNFDDELGRHVEAASWRAWVDAETGDILQLFPQFAFADAATEMAKGKGWVNAPSAEPVDTEFRINSSVDSTGQYCLQLDGVFEKPKYNDGTSFQGLPQTLRPPETFCSNVPDFTNELLPCQDRSFCICRRNGNNIEPFAYLHMNAYSNVDRYQRVLDAALCEPSDSTNIAACHEGHFRAAKDRNDESYVPMRIGINNGNTSGSHVTLGDHLVLGGVGAAFFSDTCSDAPSPSEGLRPAAQDATVIIHEFSHVVTDGLLSSRPDDWCGESACPVPHSLDLVHDLADGLTAIHTNTNWFGAWFANVVQNDTNKSETNGTLRELNYDRKWDHFPEHRNWGKWLGVGNPVKFGHKEYADGQIAGAALWAVAESMERWIPTAGRADFQATLLNVLPDFRYFPDACKFKQGRICDYPDQCDLDVYRLLHFLLRALLENQAATGVTVSANKILAGFAKTGIFLVPPQCLGASTGVDSEAIDSYCPPPGEYGGDAIIEITDDWLKHGPKSDPPEFDIWTGPQYRFDDDHAVVAQAPDEPCNKYFKVAIANNCEFKQYEPTHRLMKETDYLPVNNDCQAKWSPDDDFWQKVTKASREEGLSDLYYRVVTSPDKTDTVRSSSEYPGNPNYNPDTDDRVDPPFAILNDTGEPVPEVSSSPCN